MAWPKVAAGVIEELKRKIASIQEQWRSTRRENERLREENERLRQREKQWEQEGERLRQEREGLREEIERLKKQLEEAQAGQQAASRTVFPWPKEIEPEATRAQVRQGLWPASQQS